MEKEQNNNKSKANSHRMPALNFNLNVFCSLTQYASISCYQGATKRPGRSETIGPVSAFLSHVAQWSRIKWT